MRLLNTLLAVFIGITATAWVTLGIEVWLDADTFEFQKTPPAVEITQYIPPVNANVFGFKEPQDISPMLNPVSTPCAWKLMGIMEPHLALVSSGDQIQTLFLGDSLTDCQLLRVNSRAISVMRNNQEEIISFVTKQNEPTILHRTNNAPLPSLVQKVMSLPWGSSLHLFPKFKDGIAYGFSLNGITADSVLHQLGIRNGDVVTQINDVKTTQLQQLLALVPQLNNLASVQLQLMRANQPVLLNVSLE